MDKRQQERIEWIAEIVERCNRLGLLITVEECLARAQGGVIVRTHVAEALVARGYGRTPQAMFDAYLRKGSPAYVPRPPFTAREAIEATHEVGGIASLRTHAFIHLRYSSGHCSILASTALKCIIPGILSQRWRTGSARRNEIN